MFLRSRAFRALSDFYILVSQMNDRVTRMIYDFDVRSVAATDRSGLVRTVETIEEGLQNENLQFSFFYVENPNENVQIIDHEEFGMYNILAIRTLTIEYQTPTGVNYSTTEVYVNDPRDRNWSEGVEGTYVKTTEIFLSNPMRGTIEGETASTSNYSQGRRKARISRAKKQIKKRSVRSRM